MVRIPNPLDALEAVAAFPASLAITALLKLTDPAADATIYGLADSAGPLSLDGFDTEGLRTLSAIALAHGDAVDPEAPLTVVATDLFPERRPDADQELRRVAATLEHRDRMLAERRVSQVDEGPARLPARAEWSAADIEVSIGPGTEPRSERAAVLATHWAVSTVTAKARITVSGRGACPEQVRLVVITDLDPYISGARSRALRLAKRAFS